MNPLFRLRCLFRRDKLEVDMAAEMRAHLDAQTRRNLASGMSVDDARAAAHRQFGGVAQIQERARDARFVPWLDDLSRDIRLAGRHMRRSPGFTVVAILSLALGIGANTAMFSVIDAVLLRNLPVQRPEELALFRWRVVKDGPQVPVIGSWDHDAKTGATTCTSFSLRMLEEFRRMQDPPLAGVFGFALIHAPIVQIDGQAEVSNGVQLVSGNYAEVLGLRRAAGRLLTDADDRAAAEPVAMISYRYWQARFGGDPAAIGKSIVVNRVSMTIVGVTPQGFHGTLDVGDAPDISLPLAHASAITQGPLPWDTPSLWWVCIMGRRAPGVTLEQAEAGAAGVFQQLAREAIHAEAARRNHADARSGDVPDLSLAPGGQGLMNARHEYARHLVILSALVGTVLLIACANVANLLLARATVRRREMAMRLAIGASRSRLIRQLLTESCLLALGGAALGFLFAAWGKDMLLAIPPSADRSLVVDMQLDVRILVGTCVAAVVTGILFGLLPAWQATRLDCNRDFQGGTRGREGRPRSVLARTLLVGQIALSAVLLVSAGLFVRTLGHARDVDPGFDRERLLMFRLDVGAAGINAAAAPSALDRVAEQVRLLPGIRAVSYANLPLLSRAGWSTRITVPGRETNPGSRDTAMVNAIGPDYFAALGLQLTHGRGFEERDAPGAPLAAIVNQALARQFFGDQSPVGRSFRWSRGPGATSEARIIGVVQDAMYSNLRQGKPPTVYFPFAQIPAGESTVLIRTAADPDALGDSLRRAVQRVEPRVPVSDLRSLDTQMERLFASERQFARLAGGFGVLALALVAIGLYGLLAYTVARRTNEIGVRMALGALPRRVVGMVLRQSLGLVIAGAALGLVGAAFSTRLIAAMLFGISPLDPLTYAGTATLIVIAGLAASWLPARRAAKVDPVIALRTE